MEKATEGDDTANNKDSKNNYFNQENVCNQATPYRAAYIKLTVCFSALRRAIPSKKSEGIEKVIAETVRLPQIDTETRHNPKREATRESTYQQFQKQYSILLERELAEVSRSDLGSEIGRLFVEIQ